MLAIVLYCACVYPCTGLLLCCIVHVYNLAHACYCVVLCTCITLHRLAIVLCCARVGPCTCLLLCCVVHHTLHMLAIVLCCALFLAHACYCVMLCFISCT